MGHGPYRSGFQGNGMNRGYGYGGLGSGYGGYGGGMYGSGPWQNSSRGIVAALAVMGRSVAAPRGMGYGMDRGPAPRGMGYGMDRGYGPRVSAGGSVAGHRARSAPPYLSRQPNYG